MGRLEMTMFHMELTTLETIKLQPEYHLDPESRDSLNMAALRWGDEVVKAVASISRF